MTYASSYSTEDISHAQMINYHHNSCLEKSVFISDKDKANKKKNKHSSVCHEVILVDNDEFV